MIDRETGRTKGDSNSFPLPSVFLLFLIASGSPAPVRGTNMPLRQARVQQEVDANNSISVFMVNFKFLLSSNIKLKVFQYKNNFRSLGHQRTDAELLGLARRGTGREVCTVNSRIRGPVPMERGV